MPAPATGWLPRVSLPLTTALPCFSRAAYSSAGKATCRATRPGGTSRGASTRSGASRGSTSRSTTSMRSVGAGAGGRISQPASSRPGSSMGIQRFMVSLPENHRRPVPASSIAQPAAEETRWTNENRRPGGGRRSSWAQQAPADGRPGGLLLGSRLGGGRLGLLDVLFGQLLALLDEVLLQGHDLLGVALQA